MIEAAEKARLVYNRVMCRQFSLSSMFNQVVDEDKIRYKRQRISSCCAAHRVIQETANVVTWDPACVMRDL
jgi:hypothetical protein